MVITGFMIDAFHEQLITLWAENEDGPFASIVPMIYTEFQPNSLVFVGINPSFNAKAIMRVMQNSEARSRFKSEEEVNNFYRFDRSNVLEKIKDFQVIQHYHKLHLPYYTRNWQIAGQLENIHWEQIDIFQVRHSIQEEVISRLNQATNKSFFGRQIDLFLTMLEHIAPKVIVILNQKTGTLLKKEFSKIDSNFLSSRKAPDQYELCLYGKTIPVLFSMHIAYKKQEDRISINQKIIDFVRKYQ